MGRGAWSLLAPVGFSGILILEVFRPGLVSGGHPGPLEPILIAVGGGTLAGLRQYLPRKLDFSTLFQEELDRIAAELNERPRETLDWKTPAERFTEFVAMTG